jgi:DNA replicative helicase MCM subunit Mcm2 (Cdc46/Mcm family)
MSKPGDRVTVTGIYRAMPMRVKATQRSLKAVYKTYIDVIHFSRTEKGRMGDKEQVDFLDPQTPKIRTLEALNPIPSRFLVTMWAGPLTLDPV